MTGGFLPAGFLVGWLKSESARPEEFLRQTFGFRSSSLGGEGGKGRGKFETPIVLKAFVITVRAGP